MKNLKQTKKQTKKKNRWNKLQNKKAQAFGVIQIS